ncbi:MAG TPA: RsmB/NOP family class I SAM-dependent RNA methyltransferase [Rhodothermales bacterium]|nr:RsmB/NOP family class I SAM-dependent RNA methyltransferase [Rhodothermales bacterium]
MDAHPFDRYRTIVPAWDAFCDALERPLPTCIWTNLLRTTPTRMHHWLETEGFALAPLPWCAGAFRLPAEVKPGTLLPYRIGHVHVQEEVSMIPPLLLAPLPGERVLDACAAPGNKTAQIAAAMQNRGTVVANDRSEGRLHILRRTMARLGIMNVTTTVADAARYPDADESYDRVLVDVPCSCEGTSRKHPHMTLDCSAEHGRRMGGVQKVILRRAVDLCKPGGRIVYSTCTYAPEENEAVVNAVLNESQGTLRLLPACIDGLVSSAGLEQWNGAVFDATLRHCVRIWPHQNDSGGFFVAVLEKTR